MTLVNEQTEHNAFSFGPLEDFEQPQLQDVISRVTQTPSELLSGSSGFPMQTRTEYPIVATPAKKSWLDTVTDVLSWGYNAPEEYLGELGGTARDALIDRYLIKPKTETVNTQGTTETHIDPREQPPRGQISIGSIPERVIFWPWDEQAPRGEQPAAAVGGISIAAIIAIGLGIFLLSKK